MLRFIVFVVHNFLLHRFLILHRGAETQLRQTEAFSSETH